MKNRTSISLLVSITLLLIGVGGCEPDDEEVVCPRCDDVLSWDTAAKRHTAYGALSLEYPKDDSYAWQILDKCPGWNIYEDHKGGTGDTLEIVSCNNGVKLIWAFDHFFSVQLSQGWTGATVSKMAIGSSYQDFVQAYPGYDSSSILLDEQTGDAHLYYESGTASFEKGTLDFIIAY